MRLLLDTHIFLWFVSADPRLPHAYRSAIENPANDVLLSVASIWEATITFQIGKLPLPASPAEYLPRQREAHGIASLPIYEAVFLALTTLPPHHRDPFDRLLVAQAMTHGLTLASVDPEITAYPVPLLPAS